ncbi:K+/H+ antiporter [Terrihabitans soli]|uniref:K+/H+ antiporter n=1 Tax=Terrihabitans soli TaxID=708113 RepID=A0A6S6QPU8_9HYPH|nr:potassium/proton antiporter [Terrihabitans soli]BCJ91039.1 K+/H+ antiporter [Terrihabitans soli]
MQSITLVNWILFAGSALLVAGILSSLVAQRFGAPLLLVFLGIGMLIGEDGPGGVAFSDFSMTYLIGSFALAIILFDGGLRTRLSQFEGVLAPSAVLASAGVVFTALIVSVLAMPLLNLSFPEALLIGAMIAPTDAAAVFFLLRSGGLHLHRRVGATLEVESGTNDPVAVLLTIVLVEYLADAGGETGIFIIGTLIWHGVIGGLLGLAGGYLLVWLLNRVSLPAGLHPLLAVACAVSIFALAQVAHSSGFLAVYIAGLVVGNRRVRAFASITDFHDAATWLVQILMFVVLGLLVTPSNLLTVIAPGVIVALFLMIVARPIAVFLSLQPFRFSVNERLFVSWVGLRGAVSIFLAAIPTLAGLPNGDLYFNIAFIVVVISLIVQGWTLTPLARRLGLALPQTRPDVSRVEIDLPGQQEHEMVGYYIEEGAAVVLSPGASPRWARPVFVVRDDRILEPAMAGGLKPGDYAYFLAPPERVRELDRIFTVSADTGEHANFPLRSGVQLGVLSDLYGLDVEEELRDRTVAEHFDTEVDDEPAPGDKLSLGPAMLVVRTVKDGRVNEAELELATGSADEPPVEPDRFDRLLRKARTGLHKLEAKLFNRR